MLFSRKSPNSTIRLHRAGGDGTYLSASTLVERW
jgi:hypothetical protein